MQLERLGRAIGGFLEVPRVALGTWEEAVDALLGLGRERSLPVVLDEFEHILEADSSVESILGHVAKRRGDS